jgi:DNA-binding GntR family transcriptional regulator
MSFQPNGNLVEQVTDYIAEKIIQNEFKPGTRIYDSKLANEMGVSRTPIREAIRVLERNRLVELIPRRGVVVTEISDAVVEWFYDVFEQLYSLVARKAAENHTPAHIKEIEKALKKIESSAKKKDTVGYYDHIFAFAAAGMKAAHNPLLEGLIKDLWPVNRRIEYATLLQREDDLKENVKFFQEATRHLKNRDADKTEAVIRAFARTEKQFALQLLTKN